MHSHPAMFVYLLWLVFVLSISTQARKCTKGGSGKFDWKRKDDINMHGNSRYPGEWFVIDCRLQDNTTNVSLWQVEGKSEKRIVPEQQKVTELNQVFNITNVTLNEEGNYCCKACNRTDKSLGYLNVHLDGKAYQTPKILNKTESNVSYGSIRNIDCEVTGWYAMNWYKNDSIHPLASVNLAYWQKDGIRISKKRLTFKTFTEKNDGLYICEVQRRQVSWKAFDYVYLRAKEVKPTLEINIKSVVNVNNTRKSLVFRCKVQQAHPAAVFEWSECIDALYNCSCGTMGWFRREGNSSKEKSTLIVTNQEFKKVSYRCTAKNWLGQDSLLWITINTNGVASMKPQITKTPRFETVGDNVTLVCESNGSVAMKWKKNAANSQEKITSYKRNGFNVTRKRLDIVNLQKKDEGLYECHVKVDKYNWTDDIQVNIAIKVKPNIAKGNSNSETKFKKGMELKCALLTKSVPKAKISWTRCICESDCSKCSEWLKLQNTSVQTNSELLNKLTIQRLTSDRVIYRCTAINEAGSDERKWIVVRASTQQDKNNVVLIIIVSAILLVLCILVIMFIVVLYRRRNRYGGFYIFTSPPMPHHIASYEEEEGDKTEMTKLK